MGREVIMKNCLQYVYSVLHLFHLKTNAFLMQISTAVMVIPSQLWFHLLISLYLHHVVEMIVTAEKNTHQIPGN